MHSVDTAQIGCFAATGRSHHRNNMIFWNFNVHIFDYVVGAKICIEIFASYNCTLHLLVVSFVIMFNNNTHNNKISDAPQAKSSQSLYGLVA